MVVFCILSCAPPSKAGVFPLISFLCKTSQNIQFVSSCQTACLKQTMPGRCLLDNNYDLGPTTKSKTNVLFCLFFFFTGETELGQMTYKVPVCTVKNSQGPVETVLKRKNRDFRVSGTGPTGNMVQSGPLEQKPQEPLGWGTARHLTLSSAGPHSWPPFHFAFSSITGPLPFHHLPLEG